MTWTTPNGLRVLQVLRGRCNTFLVRDGDACVLIDAGGALAFLALRAVLAREGVRPGDLRALVLTHTHFDHATSAARVKEAYGCPVVVHAAEAGFLEAGDCPVPAGTVWFTRRLIQPLGRRARRFLRYAPVQADVRVEGPTDLGCFGVRARLLPTPGHTAGSISVVVDDQVAIVGDAMVGFAPLFVFPPWGDDVPGLVASWGRLLGTGCRVFLPAHGFRVPRAALQRAFDRRQ